MFIETKTFTVTEGSSQKVVDHFTGEGVIEHAEGFIDLSVLVKRVRRGEEEVIVLIRWGSEDNWKAWEKSEPHLEMHRQSRGKPKPEHIIDVKLGLYDVKSSKSAVVS
ncbi:antibiotic biosynthesis monooxygenase [Bacillus horti]|uniref:Heme oxygenase (Staphylobilin-producing) n=1 Tax=Caldalkalibacillus horti TaxID=77523 RepID=A0ABT9W3T8_9BACI|nr:antibiotic biosynthesis monooxygenase [Bacillus horti]MDQ0167916.1 heme oxygenase (staphylobilin-producing) [Bacillus horti]